MIEGYAITRRDALDLGRILASHFKLFRHVSSKEKLLEDDQGFYRFSDECIEKWRINKRKQTRSVSSRMM